MTVYDDGKHYLETNYTAKDWLFHTQILVSANETVLRSQTVETFNKAHKSEVLSNGIWESIFFIDDNGITKFIAENNDATIKVRFQGTQYYDDKVLKNKIKQNIKHAYELSEMIKQRTELLQL